MGEITDKDVLRWLVAQYPPTNRNLISKAIQEIEDPTLKEALKQWLDVVKGSRALIDIDLYEKVWKKAKLEGII